MNPRLERFVPRIASEWDLDAPGTRHRQVDGTLCFVDISGFTNLSERLARRGRIGAEELTDVLDRVFGEMLRLAYDRGGSLLKFGGDALLLLFDGPDHPVQATSAAVEMRAALRKATTIPTSVGRIALKMSVGLHTGPIDFYFVGSSHRELVVTGEVATVTTEMEAAADAGEILISPRLAAALPADSASTTKGPGSLLRWRKAPVGPVGPQARVDVGSAVIAACVPTALRHHLEHGAAEPEHRVATVAFVKFKGIAAAMSAGGPDRVSDDLDELVDAVQQAADEEGVTFLATDIDADGGKVILTAGAPTTQTDDEGRVLRAVRRVVDAGTRLPVRVGVNRGHVFAGEIGTEFRSTYTVMGDTVNLAARLMAAAPPGGVYVAPAVLDRSRSLFEATPLEPFRVKGKAEPVHAFAMGRELGTRTDRSGGLPFAGRDAELNTLTAALDGEPATVVVVGETGIGKSRLVAEAVATTTRGVIRIQGEANGADNPYWAFRDPLRALLGIARASQDEMAVHLIETVAELDPGLLPWLPLIGDVLHIRLADTTETAAIEPRYRPDRTATVVARLLRAAVPGPLVVVGEDHHWMDEASIGLLHRLPTEHGSIVLVVTTRPPATVEGSVTIPLGNLDTEAARSLTASATLATPLRPHELEAIVERAGGNPLFLEEILRVVKEKGTVGDLPDSLDAVVGAEIDTLPPLARRLLRYSSVLGRSFRRVVLDELLAPEEVTLDDATRRALARFVVSDGPDRWRFRHAVMHDVAYAGLSYQKRRQLHARAGRVIERLAGADTDAVAEFLALHYAQAGEHVPAWRYGVVAGDKARRAFANVEASGHYRRALDAARRGGIASDTERARVWTALGDAQEQAGEYGAAADSFGVAMRLLEDPVAKADLHLRRARVKMRGGRYAAALSDVTRGGRGLDDSPGSLACSARLESFRAVIRVTQERYREALAAAHRAEAAATATGEDEALARAYVALDWAYYMSGQGERAVYGRPALEIYHRLGQPDKASDVMLNLGAWAYYEGRWNDAVDWYERAQVEARRAGNEVAAAGAGLNIAEVRIGQGRFDDAEPAVVDAVRTFRAAGDAYSGMFAEMLAGRILLGRGALDEAAGLFARLEDEAVGLGQMASALEAVTLRAEILTAEGHPDRALEILAAAEVGAGDDAELLRASVARARAKALAAIGDSRQALDQVDVGLESARSLDLAYEEVLLLDLRDALHPGGADVERRESLRIRLGLITTPA